MGIDSVAVNRRNSPNGTADPDIVFARLWGRLLPPLPKPPAVSAHDVLPVDPIADLEATWAAMRLLDAITE